MAIIKSFTSLEQSRKLAEILPTESADMYYISGDECDICFGRGVYEEIADWICEGMSKPADVPCWSLAALLNVLPTSTLDSSDDHCYRLRCNECFTEWHDNPIDACIDAIENLREQMIYDFNNR